MKELVTASEKCIACGHATDAREYGALIIQTCQTCGQQRSKQTPKINNQSEQNIISDQQLKASLQPFRKRAYEDILFATKSNITHLDVGCSTGQLLVMSRAVGNKTIGVEPETLFAKEAKSQGLDIFESFSEIPSSYRTQIDLITFMDVLGHIPNAREALIKSKEFLSDDGCLLIKTPIADGFFFKLAKFLCLARLNVFWHRIWQTQFSSPQIHYFTANGLIAIANSLQMDITLKKLPAMQLEGLFERIRPSFPTNRWGHLGTYILLLVCYPVITLLPKDSAIAHLKRK